MKSPDESNSDAPRIKVTLLANPAKEREGVQRAEVTVPGWEAHRCEVHVAKIDGEPRVVGLLLEPRWDDAPDDRTLNDLIMTRARFTAFPMARIAHAVATLALGDLHAVHQQLSDLARMKPEVGDPRQRTTPEQVAAIYKWARAAGLAPRAEVTKRLRVSNRTADRYIAKARKEGLLPAYSSERKGTI